MAPLRSLVKAIAGYGLPGGPKELCSEPLSAEDWEWLLGRVQRERLSGLLARAIADGAVTATPRQVRQVAWVQFAADGLTAALDLLLLKVVDLLVRAGIEYRTLKGSSVARLDYPEPSIRSFIDIDLLVRPEQFDQAVAVLTKAGYIRRSPQLRRGFDRRFGKGATLASKYGLEIDLHRTLDRGPFGLAVGLDELWRGSVTFDVDGRSMLTLPQEQRFLSVCFHAALGNIPPRLTPLRDVAQMLLNGRVDSERVRSLSASWRAEIVVARAVQLAWSTLTPTVEVPLSVWARHYRPEPWETRILRVYVDPHQSQVAKSFATLKLVPGVSSKLAYLWAIAFPSSSYLAARKRSYLGHWRRAGLPWRRPRAT